MVEEAVSAKDYVEHNMNQILTGEIDLIRESYERVGYTEQQIPDFLTSYFNQFGFFELSGNTVLVDVKERRLQKVYEDEEEMFEDLQQEIEKNLEHLEKKSVHTGSLEDFGSTIVRPTKDSDLYISDTSVKNTWIVCENPEELEP